MNRVLTVAVLVVMLVLGFAQINYAQYDYNQPKAQAADVKTQLNTAVTHSGFAASGTSLAYVQQHLGHALNCIEGKGGKNFNASWGNVCEGQGNGILTDLKTASASGAVMPLVQRADDLAVGGVKSTDLTTAKLAAQGVQALLKIVAENVK